jgi:hypothetical protein
LVARKTHLAAAIRIAHLLVSAFSSFRFSGYLCSFAFELLVEVPMALRLSIGLFSQNQCCQAKS